MKLGARQGRLPSRVLAGKFTRSADRLRDRPSPKRVVERNAGIPGFVWGKNQIHWGGGAVLARRARGVLHRRGELWGGRKPAPVPGADPLAARVLESTVPRPGN